jgi:hypothetical protein
VKVVATEDRNADRGFGERVRIGPLRKIQLQQRTVASVGVVQGVREGKAVSVQAFTQEQNPESRRAL